MVYRRTGLEHSVMFSFSILENPVGVQVCRTAFLQLLGIGRARLARTKKAFRGEDARRYGPFHFMNICSKFLVKFTVE